MEEDRDVDTLEKKLCLCCDLHMDKQIYTSQVLACPTSCPWCKGTATEGYGTSFSLKKNNKTKQTNKQKKIGGLNMASFLWVS